MHTEYPETEDEQKVSREPTRIKEYPKWANNSRVKTQLQTRVEWDENRTLWAAPGSCKFLSG